MKPKKAAYVATVYSHLAVFHIPYMRMLQDQGFEVHAYASVDHCKEDVENAGLECRDVTFSRTPLAPGNWKSIAKMVKLFKREQYDLIHVHTPVASIVCRIAARLAGCGNVVYTAHGFHFFKGAPLMNWLVYYPIERLMARLTDKLVVINEEDYERAKKFAVRGSVHYLPGVGVDTSKYRNVDKSNGQRIRAELGIQDDKFVVLCIAELNGNKNQEQLLRSIRVMKESGTPAVCLLAGTGKSEPRLKKLVEQWQLTDAVRFLGFRRDIPDLLQAADVVALVSKREGLPKVLLEALAAGKPLIATDVRGSRELVEPWRNGYLVPVDDVGATADALTELGENRLRRDAMGRESYERANRFDIGYVADQLRQLYGDSEPIPRISESTPINEARKLG